MAKIYEKCDICLVLSGGIGGLAGFAEKTPWIGRSWTLQEAWLPKEVCCIFRWEQGSGNWDSGLRIDEFILPDVAMAPLKDIM